MSAYYERFVRWITGSDLDLDGPVIVQSHFAEPKVSRHSTVPIKSHRIVEDGVPHRRSAGEATPGSSWHLLAPDVAPDLSAYGIRHTPYFTWVMTMVQTLMFATELVVNFRSTGYFIQLQPYVNYLIGPAYSVSCTWALGERPIRVARHRSCWAGFVRRVCEWSRTAATTRRPCPWRPCVVVLARRSSTGLPRASSYMGVWSACCSTCSSSG